MGEEIIPGAGWMSKFLASGGITPYPPVGNFWIWKNIF